MWWPWGSSSDKSAGSSNPQNESPKQPQTTPTATTDLKKHAADKVPDGRKLPQKLHQIMEKSDKEENFFDELVEG